jgi:hypothetical protein
MVRLDMRDYYPYVLRRNGSRRPCSALAFGLRNISHFEVE